MFRIAFGKHKGSLIKDLPCSYLTWLWTPDKDVIERLMYSFVQHLARTETDDDNTRFRSILDEFSETDTCTMDIVDLCFIINKSISKYDKENPGYPNTCARIFMWLQANQRETVLKVREYRRKHRLCSECWNILVPIGDGRSNGKYGLYDWDERTLHKKCWLYQQRIC